MSALKSQLPVYHTRAMKRQFAEKAGRMCSLKPAQLRTVYRELTCDSSLSEDSVAKAVDSLI